MERTPPKYEGFGDLKFESTTFLAKPTVCHAAAPCPPLTALPRDHVHDIPQAALADTSQHSSIQAQSSSVQTHSYATPATTLV